MRTYNVEPAATPRAAEPVVSLGQPKHESSPLGENERGLLEAKLAALDVNSRVLHPKFGAGVVVGKTDKFIHVKFTLGEKKFVFPDAFLQGFLEVK